jgi:MoaE-MoaD fusion protein
MDAVVVSYFAAARELSGVAEESLSIAAPVLTGAELLGLIARAHPRLAPLASRMRLAVNDELVDTKLAGVQVRAGDRVAILPPVAGGSDAAARYCVAVREAALSIDEAFASVAHTAAGGVALFVGVVRDHAEGKPVARLDYEAHPVLAQKQLEAIASALLRDAPEVRLCALHRVGQLAVGELAVIVAASAPHREQAFAVCRAAIERIKAEVPIWKKEWEPSGAASWVNLE